VAVGAGTQRVTDELQALMPDQTIARLDRDTASRVGAMDQVLEAVASGQTNVLIGTQMLTKGHDFPNVTLVGILNADQGLFGTDFRSEERLAQSILQVAGRAGRRDEPGEVLVQTHFPNHPLLSRLLNEGYMAFAELALAERERAGWPPYSHVAVIRAESTQRRRGFDFLAAIRQRAEQQEQDVLLLGPAAATMERRNGRYRFQLVLQSKHRKPLHQLLDKLLNALPDLPASRQVRWAIDVDPVEL
jgi:primosomal protein N' (replication factor Y)